MSLRRLGILVAPNPLDRAPEWLILKVIDDLPYIIRKDSIRAWAVTRRQTFVPAPVQDEIGSDTDEYPEIPQVPI